MSWKTKQYIWMWCIWNNVCYLQRPRRRIRIYTREIQMKTLNIFYLIIYWIQNVHNDFIFLRSLQCVQYKCSSVLEVHGCLYKKILLAESAATRAPPAGPLHRTWKTCLPSPVWADQTHENHWGRGLASTADVEDTRRADLGLLQQLNGQYGAEHCHVATKHLYSDVHVVWTWLLDAEDSLGDLHMLHWSQCSPWPCSDTPRLSQNRVSITFPADGRVRNYFGFGEKVWRHSLLAFLVSDWW